MNKETDKFIINFEPIYTDSQECSSQKISPPKITSAKIIYLQCKNEKCNFAGVLYPDKEPRFLSVMGGVVITCPNCKCKEQTSLT